MKDIQKISAMAVWAVAALGLAGVALAEGMGGEDLETHFAKMDADGDGKVSEAEITAHHAARFAEADADKDGQLSAAELSAMQMEAMQAMLAERAARMIAALDSDGDGMISAAEHAAMPGPGRMFDHLDADGDGAVTLEEMEAAKDRRGGHGKGGHGHGHGGFWGMFGGDK